MEFLGLIFLGLLVGFISSFFGVGGGPIIMPMIYIFFKEFSPSAIIAISLGTIFLTCTLSTFLYAKSLPIKKHIITILIISLMGGYSGSLLLSFFSENLIKNLFLLFLIITLLRILIDIFKVKKNSKIKVIEPKDISLYKVSTITLIGSILSSLTGLGGGIVFVPFYLSYIKLHPRLVSPYSNLSMIMATAFGLLPHFFKTKNFTTSSEFLDTSFIGNVNPLIIILIFLGSSLTTKLGVKYNNKVDANLKRILFALMLLIFILKLLIFG